VLDQLLHLGPISSSFHVLDPFHRRTSGHYIFSSISASPEACTKVHRMIWSNHDLRSMRIRIGICGIACEKCPRTTMGKCPSGEQGCVPKDNPFCKISTCAFHKGVELCFDFPDFPCENTKLGPLSYGYCQFISGKDRVTNRSEEHPRLWANMTDDGARGGLTASSAPSDSGYL
jgi:hypothetical protein